jgi:triacylglycerol lipase
MGMETGAFSQLTRKYMRENFNPKTPDVEGTRSVLFLSTSENEHGRLILWTGTILTGPH